MNELEEFHTSMNDPEAGDFFPMWLPHLLIIVMVGGLGLIGLAIWFIVAHC